MHFTSQAALALVAVTGANAQLNQLAVAAGLKYFGSATDNPELTDKAYTAILTNATEFGQITAGNSQKWDATEPSQGTFSYTAGDVIVDLAKKNSQILRCHNLVWYNQLPSWVSSGSWTNETLTAVLKNHITNEVEHYKGQCYAWDVVNEAISDSGDGSLRDNVFYKTIGEAYIPIAFSAAAAADPGAKLYYNDYSIEFSGAKTTAALGIVDLIKKAGARIDGVGLQGHFTVGSTPSARDLAGVLEQFTAKGVEVAYTELDVRHSSVPAAAAAVEQQAKDYTSVVQACLQVKGCVGITVWDFYDKFSWVPSTFPGAGEACLYDDNLSKKPAWTAVSSALAAAGTGAAGGASSNASTTAAAVPTGGPSAAPVVGASGSASAAQAAASSAAPTSRGKACTKRARRARKA
jgi:endo-1,4-beta-xylanase